MLPARDINGPGFQEWSVLLPDLLKTCQHYFKLLAITRSCSRHILRKVAKAGLHRDTSGISCTERLILANPHVNFRENLGPGRRGWPLPGRWFRPRGWRGSRGGCSGCRGTSCWCGGRGWSSSRCGRRRSSSHRGENIDPPPSIHVVWRTRSSALRRIDVNSRVI